MTTTRVSRLNAATTSAIGWTAAVLIFLVAATVSWEASGELLYSFGALVLVLAGVLLVMTEIGINRQQGGLGAVAVAGIVVTALGALVSFVAWAVVVWTTVLGLGTLLFGLRLQRVGEAPGWAVQAITFALPAAAAAAWGGAIAFDAFAGEASAVEDGVVLGLVGTAVLVFAAGMAGLGRWQHDVSPAG